MPLLLLFLIQPFIFSHDVAVANFEINQGEDRLSLQIKMDKEDLEKLYQKNNEGKVDLTIHEDFVQKYLNEHFYLVVNKEKINFDLQEINKDKYYYHIVFTSQNKVEEVIHHIQLKNTCLIDAVEKHSNIVNFQINEKYRTFRLHEGRVRIEVKY